MRSVRSIKLENSKLKAKLGQLENQHELIGQQLQNSFASLFQGAFPQANMTSFGDILSTNIYTPLTLQWNILTYMYKTHGLIQTAIDMPVLDALRGGLEIHSAELDKDDIKDLHDDLERSETLVHLRNATIWARLYGGGGLVIITDQDPATPLDESRVKLLDFYAADRWELTQNMPGTESYTFYGKMIHKSRVLKIKGKEAPSVIRRQLNGWGMSEVERMVEDFNSYIKTKSVTYDLLTEAKVDVYRLKGFSQQLITAAGTAKTIARIQTMNAMKSTNNAVLLDLEDEFEQKQITFTGLAEVMKQNMVGIASALRIPMTKLFGLSAAGFSSGEDDIENYNAMVESEVREPLRPVVRKVLELKSFQLFGEKLDMVFNFKPLRVMSSVDEENVKTQQSARLMDYYTKGLLDPQETMEIAEKEKLVPIESKVSKGAMPEPPMIQAVDPGSSEDQDEAA